MSRAGKRKWCSLAMVLLMIFALVASFGLPQALVAEELQPVAEEEQSLEVETTEKNGDSEGEETDTEIPNETLPAEAVEDGAPAVVLAGIVERDAGDELKVVWQRGEDENIAEYRVYRSAEGEATFTEIAVLDSESVQYVDQGLIQGQWYQYYVTAVDNEGNMSAPSNTVSAKARTGIRIPVNSGSGAALPDDLYAELNSDALFLGIHNDNIRMTAMAVDVEGREVPVSGTWRFAADFGAFRRIRAEGESTAVAHFYADETGEGEIAAEFYPLGSEIPVVTATAYVRALDWYLNFNAPQSATVAAGGEYHNYTAIVSDGEGNPVTDPAAVVRFEVEEISRDTEGRLQADGLTPGRSAGEMIVVFEERKLGVSSGSPDEFGEIHAVYVAGVDPGRDLVSATLIYNSNSGTEENTKVIAHSQGVFVDVVPALGAFIAWEPSVVEVDGREPAEASYSWYDSYGNKTDAPAEAVVFVQVPDRMPFVIGVDGEWSGAGEWVGLNPGEPLEIKVNEEVQLVPAGEYALSSYVEGETAAPPAGMGQANRPLLLFVTEDIVPDRDIVPWIREAGAAAGGLALAAAALWRFLLGTKGA